MLEDGREICIAYSVRPNGMRTMIVLTISKDIAILLFKNGGRISGLFAHFSKVKSDQHLIVQLVRIRQESTLVVFGPLCTLCTPVVLQASASSSDEEDEESRDPVK